MKSKLLFFAVYSFLCSVFFLYPVNADQGAEKAAVDSAEKWLNLVDNGSYEQSWDEAAEFLKNAVSKEKWLESMKAFRKPLGKLISRTVISKQYTTSLPGAPDGEYVVIQFETSFGNKEAAIETVTPMLDKDGTWRVSGYYIK